MKHDIHVTFDKGASKFVLALFGYVTKCGIIVDLVTEKPIPGLDGKSVRMKDFAGVVRTNKGRRLLRRDIVDLLQVADGNVQVAR